LQTAYDQREESLISLTVNPLLDGIRSDPRFNDLPKKMRLDN
jgi:hypothetical protein